MDVIDTKNRKVIDMTIGKPLKLILMFAIPLFIGNIFQQIYSMVDTMIAGYFLGDLAIASIGATSSLSGFIIDFAIGMNSGFAIVITQKFGAKNLKDIKKSIASSLELNIIITIFLTIISLIFLKPLMHFMKTPNSIFNDAYKYIFIICIGMVTTIFYNSFAGILRSFGNSKIPLYFLILSSIINIILDLLFIIVFKTGIAGAALATIISQGVSAILEGIYILNKYKEYLPNKKDFKFNKIILKTLIVNGISMALMYCVIDFGSIIFSRANNNLGENIISAHTAARRLISIMSAPLGTLATALSTFVGQNYGAYKLDRIKKGLHNTFSLQIIWSLFSLLIILTLAPFLVKLTTGSKNIEIINNAVLSLKWHVSCFIPLGLLVSLRMSMQAMNRKIAPITSSCLELSMKVLSAIVFIPKLGFLGTCITEPITWIIMFIFLLIAYLIQRKNMFKTNINNDLI